MRIQVLATVLITICITLQIIGSQKNSPIDFTKIDDYIQHEMKEGRIPGLALGIVKGDEIIYQKGYGIADHDGTPVTVNTPFIIGSVSKTFTALGIMQLVEKDKIELDAPVQRYIPWFTLQNPDYSAKVTVRDLLMHKSGLPREHYTAGRSVDSIKQRVRELHSADFWNTPGAQSLYSNVGYAVLGHLIEVASGQSYQTYIQDRIFSPLEMHHSYTSLQVAKDHGLAQGYGYMMGIPIPIAPNYLVRSLPSGYLISSVQDMNQYLISQINGVGYNGTQVLSPNGILQVQNYMWHSTPNSIEHGGATESFRAYMGIVGSKSKRLANPKDTWGIVVLHNCSESILTPFAPRDAKIVRIPEGIARILEQRTPQPPSKTSMRSLYQLIYGGTAIIILFLIYLTAGVVSIQKKYEQKRRSKKQLLIRLIPNILLNLVLPIGIFILAPNKMGQSWKMMLTIIPDLYFVCSFLMILILLGISELLIVFFILKRKPSSPSHPTAG